MATCARECLCPGRILCSNHTKRCPYRARWPDGRAPSPRPAAGSPRPASGASPRFPRPPCEFGRRGREDQPRCAAVTGSNPARGALGRVNDRPRPLRPAQHQGPPGPSPYRLATPTRAPPLVQRARPRPPIGCGCRASHAPGPALLGPDAGPSVLRPGGPSGPQCGPSITPRVTQASPVPFPLRAVHTWPPRPRGWGRPREAWGAEGKSWGGGDAAPRPGAPRVPGSPARRPPGAPPRRVPASGGGARHHPTGGGAPGPGAQP